MDKKSFLLPMVLMSMLSFSPCLGTGETEETKEQSSLIVTESVDQGEKSFQFSALTAGDHPQAQENQTEQNRRIVVCRVDEEKCREWIGKQSKEEKENLSQFMNDILGNDRSEVEKNENINTDFILFEKTNDKPKKRI